MNQEKRLISVIIAACIQILAAVATCYIALKARMFSAMFFFIPGVCLLVGAAGILCLQLWARKLSIICLLILTIYDILDFLLGIVNHSITWSIFSIWEIVILFVGILLIFVFIRYPIHISIKRMLSIAILLGFGFLEVYSNVVV